MERIALDRPEAIMPNPFVRKLRHGAALQERDEARLAEISSDSFYLAAGREIIGQGQAPINVHLITSGFACRYKVSAGGKRQVIGYLVPGDICDLHVAILGHMDHTIATVTRCAVSELSPATVSDLTENYPAIARALWWATLVDEAILREWLFSMGQRQAEVRIAHLFCELMARLRTVGLVTNDSFQFSVTQEVLADTLGLSIVHTNRSIQELREKGLIVLDRKSLSFPDVERIERFAEFDAEYLHLNSATKLRQAG